jgi:hypothetical protein
MNASFALVSESDTGRDPRGDSESGERILNGAGDLLRQAELLLAQIHPSTYTPRFPPSSTPRLAGNPPLS